MPSASTSRLLVPITKSHLLWEDQLKTGAAPSGIYITLTPGHAALQEEHKLNFRGPCVAYDLNKHIRRPCKEMSLDERMADVPAVA